MKEHELLGLNCAVSSNWPYKVILGVVVWFGLLAIAASPLFFLKACTGGG